MARRILIVLILLVMASCLIGCQTEDIGAPPQEEETIYQNEETVIEIVEPEEETVILPSSSNTGEEGRETVEHVKQVKEEEINRCTISIDCKTVLDNLDKLDPGKLEIIPQDGIILAPIELEFKPGETVFDVLLRVTKEKGIHMEHSSNPALGSYYVEGINNLYEFDCGELSGWTYTVNGESIGYGSSNYILSDGDVVKWLYTCDQGRDIGGN
ncbi:MAG: DUF4430 domain-containing protein [Clostridiales bacterium]|jgi:hypothetical protein|nr:DUF4430 domain-containing protein [Clostridiales bacterium]